MFKSRVQKILYINTKGQHKINQNKFPLQHDLYFRFRLCNSCVCVCVCKLCVHHLSVSFFSKLCPIKQSHVERHQTKTIWLQQFLKPNKIFIGIFLIPTQKKGRLVANQNYRLTLLFYTIWNHSIDFLSIFYFHLFFFLFSSPKVGNTASISILRTNGMALTANSTVGVQKEGVGLH